MGASGFAARFSALFLLVALAAPALSATDWNAEESPTETVLAYVRLSRDGSGDAVATHGIFSEVTEVFRRTGGSWLVEQLPLITQEDNSTVGYKLLAASSFGGVAFAGSGENGRLVKYSSGNWAFDSYPVEEVDVVDRFPDVELLSASVGFALAADTDSIFKWDGNSWSLVRRISLVDFSMVDGNLGFGCLADQVFITRDGWQTVDEGTSVGECSRISAYSENLAFTVAGRAIYRWDGSSWVEETLPRVDNPRGLGLHDVAIAGLDRAFAVGDGGLVLEWNGNAWSVSPTGVDNDLFAVDASENEVYAVGVGGVILRGTERGGPSPPRRNRNPTASAGQAVDTLVNDGVVLNGTGADSDGAITLYEWDFDGDGSFEWNSTETGIVTTRFERAGTFNAAFRATDNDSATSTATTTIIVREPPTQQQPPSPALGIGGGESSGGSSSPGAGAPAPPSTPAPAPASEAPAPAAEAAPAVEAAPAAENTPAPAASGDEAAAASTEGTTISGRAVSAAGSFDFATAGAAAVLVAAGFAWFKFFRTPRFAISR